MKIEKITLSRQELVEKDGEYELVEKDKETVPCVITNRALQIARQEGVTKSSLATDLLNLQPADEINMNDLKKIENGKMAPEDANIKLGKFGEVDDLKMLQAIYVGYIGGQILLGNKQPKYSFDDFLEVYNADVVERTTLYMNLLTDTRKNDFKGEIEKSTSKKVQKGEKK